MDCKVLGRNLYFIYYFVGEIGWRIGFGWVFFKVCGFFLIICGNFLFGGERGCKDYNVFNRVVFLNWGVWLSLGKLEKRLCFVGFWY